MARVARREYLDPLTIQIAHTVQRCVRRAFLCGFDHATGKNFEHRRQWIRDRLELLASIFAIDCLTYAVMSNHLHLVLRSRPDIARGWSDEEVARRWLTLFPKRKKASGQPADPNQAELDQILNDAGRLAQLRKRLSDISWWMRCTAEPIARRANREDEVTGHFWEGRYKAQWLLDEASLLACSMYVDLNPVRAAIADTPEQSRYTGAYDRIQDMLCHATRTGKGFEESRNSKPPATASRCWEQSRQRHHSGWMSPLQIDEQHDPVGADASGCGRRASLKGFLSMSLATYLELLDWTGRQLCCRQRGQIPLHLQPVLQRQGIDPPSWCRLIQQFGKLFKRVAGSPQAIRTEAKRRGQSWMQAPGTNCFCQH
jgi:REP element-mobilizing transposase RayT